MLSLTLGDLGASGNYLTNNPSKWINLNREEADNYRFKNAQRSAWHKMFTSDCLASVVNAPASAGKGYWLSCLLRRQYDTMDEALALIVIPSFHSNPIDITENTGEFWVNFAWSAKSRNFCQKMGS